MTLFCDDIDQTEKNRKRFRQLGTLRCQASLNEKKISNLINVLSLLLKKLSDAVILSKQTKIMRGL